MAEYLYFDSAATAKPCREALAAVARACEEFGNPSSLHGAGLAAKHLLDEARGRVARALRCTPEELVFTGSGTEANNTTIFGLAALREKKSKKVITTDSEHPSVEECMKVLETRGFKVVRLSTKGGVLDLDQLKAELKEPAAFLSIMRANNETGAVYDLGAVRKLLTEAGSDAPLHCDDVQGFLKVPFDKPTAFCDLLTVSGHKIGGVKGVGALYIRKGIRIAPYIYGGGQENGLRSGTENVAAIAAFGAAAEARSSDRERLAYIGSLRDYVEQTLTEAGIVCHVPPVHLPNLLHISVPGVPGSWVLNSLSAKGICVSQGSACSAKKKGSRVLTAYGLPEDEVLSSLRISFSEDNTKEECAALCTALAEAAKLKR